MIRPYSRLYIDMDGFFASCEQYFNPEYRYRPLVVAPWNNDQSRVVTLSQEAKLVGITTGMRISEAKSIYPSLVVVSDSPSKYIKVHHQLKEILEQTFCRVQMLSIDEAVLTMPKYLDHREDSLEVANLIRKQLTHKYNGVITGSIGIASNTWLAKMASELAKPDGLVCLEPDRSDYFDDFRLNQLNGISYGTVRRLAGLGVVSVKDFREMSLALLKQTFGINGVKWYLRWQGVEVPPMVSRQNKTMSHQSVIPPGLVKSDQDIGRYLTQMSWKLTRRMRDQGLKASEIWLRVKWYTPSKNHLSLSGKIQLVEPVNDIVRFNQSLRYILKEILEDKSNLMMRGARVAKVSIGVSRLGQAEQQILGLGSMSGILRKSSGSEKLDKVIDRINQAYGKGTIIPASSLTKGQYTVSPDRIAFGHSVLD
ncbi:hypothetical protein KC853_03220 [Candidatus Saccharibacteria bacterium]|nr:hypothetical protein [Candidatus Saccharibacteria bacterium]MCB9834528.1 hypothetical protein [Candidatus Nomurabacteria bacterium]